jgi:hypothetical protein
LNVLDARADIHSPFGFLFIRGGAGATLDRHDLEELFAAGPPGGWVPLFKSLLNDKDPVENPCWMLRTLLLRLNCKDPVEIRVEFVRAAAGGPTCRCPRCRARAETTSCARLPPRPREREREKERERERERRSLWAHTAAGKGRCLPTNPNANQVVP